MCQVTVPDPVQASNYSEFICLYCLTSPFSAIVPNLVASGAPKPSNLTSDTLIISLSLIYIMLHALK